MTPVARAASTSCSSSVGDTESIGRALGERLRAGDVVLLFGGLGAGKTAFVRGLAEGLGADPDEVSSPTFTLMQEYQGRVALRHLDLYRVESLAEIDDLGLEEAGADAVLAIEWAERMGEPSADAWRVDLRVVDEDTREVAVSGPPGRAPLTPRGSWALPS